MFKVSVIMAAYNAETYIEEAIRSVLNQTFKDFELIVVNDGSEDQTLNVIKSIPDKRIKIINLDNSGAANARNSGIRSSKGEYIAILDADDVALPDRLQKQVDFLDASLEYGIVGGNASVIDKDGMFVTNTNQTLDWHSIKMKLPASPFIHSTVMFRSSLIKTIGFYPDISTSEDALFFLKISKVSKMINLQDCLINYRLLPSALSRRSTNLVNISKNFLSHFHSTGELPDDYKKKYENASKSFSEKEKIIQYSNLLAKKYLWGSHPNARLARRSILNLGLSMATSVQSIFLLILSFFPSSFIKNVYSRIKK